MLYAIDIAISSAVFEKKNDGHTFFLLKIMCDRRLFCFDFTCLLLGYPVHQSYQRPYDAYYQKYSYEALAQQRQYLHQCSWAELNYKRIHNTASFTLRLTHSR